MCLALAIAMAWDAHHRGSSPLKWFLGTLLFPYIAVPIRFWPGSFVSRNAGTLSLLARISIGVGVVVSAQVQSLEKDLGRVFLSMLGIAAILISVDAERTGRSGWLWFFLILFGWPITLPVYLAKRFLSTRTRAGLSATGIWIFRIVFWGALVSLAVAEAKLAISALTSSPRQTLLAMLVGSIVTPILLGGLGRRFRRTEYYQGGLLVHVTPWRNAGLAGCGGFLMLAVLGALLGVAYQGGVDLHWW